MFFSYRYIVNESDTRGNRNTRQIRREKSIVTDRDDRPANIIRWTLTQAICMYCLSFIHYLSWNHHFIYSLLLQQIIRWLENNHTRSTDCGETGRHWYQIRRQISASILHGSSCSKGKWYTDMHTSNTYMYIGCRWYLNDTNAYKFDETASMVAVS